MIAFVQQEKPWYCFLACLESFLAEQGEIVTQEEIRARTPDIFGGHENDLGGFSPTFFDRVAKAWNFEVTEPLANVEIGKGTSIFVLCHWDGDERQPHWVRLLRLESDYTYLMDPAHDSCPRKIETARFRSWPKKLFVLTKSFRGVS